MKEKLLLQNPIRKILLYSILLLMSSASVYGNNCGEIKGLEFTNSSESIVVSNDDTYVIGNLPNDFYLNLVFDGKVKSVRYTVTNLDSGEKKRVIENRAPYTFPAGNRAWNLETGNFKIEVSTYRFYFGLGRQCDSRTFTFNLIEQEECLADAGSLKTSDANVCLDDENGTEITAVPDGNAHVPEGYSTLYVLTKGSELVIVDVGATPSFTVTEGGDYTIHTFVYPEGLDLSIVELGVTTGFDVNSLLLQGGGELCASLDVAGASITVSDPDAGTLTADQTSVVLEGGSATISATPNGDIQVPSGYSFVYVLTQGESLTIVNAGGSPEFEVTEAGLYTIHTFVFPSDFDPFSVVTVGVTTGVDVLGLITEGGGALCASLDVPGAPIEVLEQEECAANAGRLKSRSFFTCIENGMASIEAYFSSEPFIPSGYQQLFVLTDAFTLTIFDVSETPNFEINNSGLYRIHTLIYDPQTLDLSIVTPGVTTGFDVNNLLKQGGGEVCGALDVRGALSVVLPEWYCRGRYSFANRGETNEIFMDDFINRFNSNEDFAEYMRSRRVGSRVYPNPVVSKLNIKIEAFDNEKFTYILKDLNGRTLEKGQLNVFDNIDAIDVIKYPRGTYFLILNSQYRNFVEKIQIKD